MNELYDTLPNNKRECAMNETVNESVRCEKCGQQLQVPGFCKELSITCPTCKHQFTYSASSASPHANSPPKKPTKSTGARISADEYRVDGEKKALNVGIGLLVLVMLFVGIGLWFVLPILIIITAIALWIQQGQLLGGGVKVSQDQFPEIDELAKKAASRLGMKRPDIFVVLNPEINAFAMGFLGKKSVVLHSALVEALQPNELLCILGHEFSHIKCGHTTWLVLTNSSGKINVPVISSILHFIFLWWSRKGEYTCDRGGLLASRDLQAAIATACKLAVGPELFKKMTVEHFVGQQEDIDLDQGAQLSEALQTHPYTVKRVQALQEYYDSPEYRSLAARNP